MTDTRLVTKYPNRRLYDRHDRSYIRLDHIRAFVQESRNFVVQAGNRDVTREVLLQTLLELEAQGAPLFSKDFLTETIRLCHEGSGGMLAAYLDECLRLLVSDATREKPVLQEPASPEPASREPAPGEPVSQSGHAENARESVDIHT